MKKTHFIARAEGFTLVEVAVATAIIGVGVSALLVSVGAGTRVNDDAQKLTQATFLAGEVREWASNQTFANLTALPSPTTYTPPHDGGGNVIADMANWSQKVTITARNPADLSASVTAGTSDIVNVDVRISFRGCEYLATSFLVTRRPG